MAHKKEIYTTVFKHLPSSNCLIDKSIAADVYNRLTAAYYHLFNSDVLTKGDYIHIFKVLCEKLPVYEMGGDKEKFKELAIVYAEFGYPPNPDMRRVIGDFIDNIEGISNAMLSKSLYALAAQLQKSNDFVGTELHARGFSLSPISEKELTTIKGIILV